MKNNVSDNDNTNDDDDDDPFLVVHPKDDNKKMSTYFKKQQSSHPTNCNCNYNCTETASHSTTSTRSTSNASSIFDCDLSKPTSRSSSTPDGFPAFETDLEEDFAEQQEETQAIQFHSDFGNGLEFGADGGDRRSSASHQASKHPSKHPFASRSTKTRKPRSSTSRNSFSDDPFAASASAFEDQDPFQQIANTSQGDFGASAADIFGESISSADGFGDSQAFPDSHHDSFGDQVFASFDHQDHLPAPTTHQESPPKRRSKARTKPRSASISATTAAAANIATANIATATASDQDVSKEEAWKKREVWKQNARTRSATSRKERGSRNPPNRHPSSDDLTVGSGRSNTSARSRRSQGSNGEGEPPRPRRRVPADKQGEEEQIPQDPVRRIRAHRRASTSATQPGLPTKVAGAPRIPRRVPPSRNRSMDENVFEQQGYVEKPALSAGRARRSGRRASLGMPLPIEPTVAADPRAMQMNYPSPSISAKSITKSSETAPEPDKKWVSDRSRNQQKIVEMFKYGDSSMASLQCDIKSESISDLQVNIEDFAPFDGNVSKNKSGDFNDENNAGTRKGPRRGSLVAAFVTRKKAPKESKSQSYDHRAAQGRDQSSLLDRIGGVAGASGSTGGISAIAAGKNESYSDRIMQAQHKKK